jgi:cytochrome c oxidase subunit 2
MKSKIVLFVLLAGLTVGCVFTTRIVRAQDAPKRIEVTAKRFTFEPAEITLKKGQPVVIVIKSLDVAHGLRFRELNAETKIDKGSSGQLEFTPTETGDFVGHCFVFCGSGHGGMAMTLHVVE